MQNFCRAAEGACNLHKYVVDGVAVTKTSASIKMLSVEDDNGFNWIKPFCFTLFIDSAKLLRRENTDFDDGRRFPGLH